MLARPCSLASTQRCSTAQLQPRPCTRTKRVVRVQASDNSSALKYPEGATVKVTKSVVVYHAPKQPQGIDLEGLEGKIVKHDTFHKGKLITANLPYKLEIMTERDGAPLKIVAHLVSCLLLHSELGSVPPS
eukprot:jgi/Chrzof1/2914/Cz12g03230.t1_FTRV[v5.2]